MTRPVTRDVEPSALPDLLQHPPRAIVAFVERDRVEVVPVQARFRPGAWDVGVARAGTPDLDGREVLLVIDDGAYWFELRGVSVRGVARRLPPEAGATPALAWYALEPRRTIAWDYGALREA